MKGLAEAATITGLLFGVAPALRGTSASLTSTIKDNHATAGRPRARLRLWIVASQVALSLVLLVTAGLLLRSFRNLATTDIGFAPDHVLVLNVNLFTAKTPPSNYTATYDRIGAQLRALPGVVSAARSMRTPLDNSEWNTAIHSDIPHPIIGDGNTAYFNFIDPYYFPTLHTPLLAGRNFNSSDSANSQPVAVINQTLARKFFPGVNGRVFSRSEFIRLKMAVLAPIPSASVSTTTLANSGALARMRTEYRTSVHRASTALSQPAPRISSFTDAMLPISTRAARSASAALMPDCILRSAEA